MNPFGPLVPFPQRTFSDRLTLHTVLICQGVLAIACAVIYLGVRETLQWSLDSALLAIARTEISAAIASPQDSLQVHEQAPLALALPAGSGYEKFAQIVDGTGQVLAKTSNLPGDAALPLPRAPVAGGPTYADIRHAGRSFRAVYWPLTKDEGDQLLAVVAMPTAPQQFALNMLAGTLALAVVLAGGAAALAARPLARRLTRPLETIAEAARQVGGQNLAARIPDVARDEELRTVTGVLNQMLDRVEEAFGTREQVIAAQRRFIADASHELCTPLGSLRGTLEVALRRPRSLAECRDCLETAHTEVVRLCRLVRDLLTLSRADSGQFAVRRVPCDLADLARDAVAAAEGTASSQGIVLDLDCAGPAPIRGDADRLREVVDNLLDNAMRYAPFGSAVEVRVWSEPHRACVSVTDHGQGLTDEERAHVFERFYRADAARARDTGGQGLGLAIAMAIARAHGGTLEVESEPQMGATFTLALPGEQSPARGQDPATRAAAADAAVGLRAAEAG